MKLYYVWIYDWLQEEGWPDQFAYLKKSDATKRLFRYKETSNSPDTEHLFIRKMELKANPWNIRVQLIREENEKANDNSRNT